MSMAAALASTFTGELIGPEHARYDQARKICNGMFDQRPVLIARCAEFDAATQEHGLAVTGGRVSHTGVAGLTLGSGSGWLERKYGMTCDSLLSAQVVTA